jgi:cell division protein FtsZ
MSEGGAALMAVGRSTGDDRARQAAEAAISSSLLDVTIDGARGILFNITGGADMTLFEINEAAAIIKESAHPDVNLIFGAQIDENLGDEVRITVIATGFEQSRVAKNIMARQPVQQQRPQQRPVSSSQTGSAPQQEQSVPRQQPPAQPQQQPYTPPQPPQQQPVVYDEDNIEIPTFLRRRR